MTIFGSHVSIPDNGVDVCERKTVRRLLDLGDRKRESVVPASSLLICVKKEERRFDGQEIDTILTDNLLQIQ